MTYIVIIKGRIFRVGGTYTRKEALIYAMSYYNDRKLKGYY